MNRKKHPDLLPLWVFAAVVLAVLYVSFAGPQQQDQSRGRSEIIPVSVNPILSIVPGMAHAGRCGYCGWYSLCRNNTYWCCTQWISTGCGGGSTDNPPTISGTVTCAQTGQNGWCVNTPQLNLTASDPQGYSLSISGDINGTPFTCGSSCTQALPRGTGTTNYTVTAATSGLTASGSSTWSYDPDPPTASLNVSTGTLGPNGWYTSPVTVQATTADAISGVASVSMSDNGGTPTASSSITINSDGTQTVSVTVTDQAGNTTTVSSSIKIDQTPPVITLTPTGTLGNNSWYKSNVNVLIAVNDAASGIQSSSYSVDGGAAVSNADGVTVPLSDGAHSISVSAADNAGNNATQSLNLNIDTIPPTVSASLNPAAPDGLNGWHKSAVILSATGADSGSGVASTEYRLDGGAWQTGSSTTVSNNGPHTIDFRVTDVAGNATISSQSFKIDTTAPAITFTPTGTQGNGSWYTTIVSLVIAATDADSGVNTLEYNLDSAGWLPVTGPISIPDGAHTIQAQSTDNAGNQATASKTINVDTVPPTQTLVLVGTSGSNGWYVSSVQASMTASDQTSSVASSTISDNGNPAKPSPITLTDGVHTLQYTTTDGAGNSVTATQTVSVDTVAPTSQIISSPAPFSVVRGTIQISGTSTDATSGLATAQISIDASTWTPLVLTSGAWSAQWDTSSQPNGAKTVYVRSIDQAGNTETPIQIPLMLDNHPPKISLSNSWKIWNSGSLTVNSDLYALKTITAVVKDPLNRWPDQPISISLSKSLPTTSDVSADVQWNRMFGSIYAPIGSYTVNVNACDENNVCSSTSGTITIPQPIVLILPFWPTPTSFPTMTPTIAPTPTTGPTPTQLAPTHQAPAPVNKTIILPPTPAAPMRTNALDGAAQNDGTNETAISLTITALMVFAFSALIDSRPKAIKKLTASLGRITSNK